MYLRGFVPGEEKGILKLSLGTLCIGAVILGSGPGCAAHYSGGRDPAAPVFEDVTLFAAVVQALAADRSLPLRVDPRALEPGVPGTRRSSEDLAAISAENLRRRAAALTALGLPQVDVLASEPCSGRGGMPLPRPPGGLSVGRR
jgi:hypothetical protein